MILRPPLPLLPAPVVGLLGMPGLALVPPRLRDEFRIPWSATDETVAKGLGAGVRAWTLIVPGPPRWMPQARAAYRRVAAPGVTIDRPPSTRRTDPVT